MANSTLTQNQRDLLSVADDAHKTGRTDAEIAVFAELLRDVLGCKCTGEIRRCECGAVEVAS